MAKKKERPWRRGLKQPRYTAKRRAEVLADVPKRGITGAARKHKVPAVTISRWMRAKQPRPVDRRNAATASSPPSESATSSPLSVKSARAAPGRRVALPLASDTKPAKHLRSRPTAHVTTTTSAPKTNAATTTPNVVEKTPPKKIIAISYTPSQRAEALEYAAKHGVGATNEKLGMSRFSIYDWRRKLTAATAGLGPSPTSGPSVADIETRRDKEILGEWKLHPGLGPSQICNQLRRKGIRVSVHTARIVMQTAGYRPPKVARHPHDQRFEAVRPNHLWHFDFMHRNIHLANTFTLILIDDHSRFVVGHGVDDAERADMVIRTFERAVARYGKPEMVMTDRGSAFWAWRGISRFTALLTEMGIDQIAAQEKETNGKSEVFNANLAKELFDVQRFADVGEMRRRLDTHLHWYNHGRTHHALGGLLVPADRYYGRVDEVLARIEAGGGRDIGDGIDLRSRSLDLFKVVSRDGVPEVWLMGKKLLDLRP